MAWNKICKYLWYPKMFPFFGCQLDGKLLWFFTFTRWSICRCHKWLAVSCSENADEVFLREIWLQKQVINKNCTINEPKMVHFQDAFIELYNKYLVMTWTLCMPGKQWMLGFIWPKKIMVTQYQPRAMIFDLTWQNLITMIPHSFLAKFQFLLLPDKVFADVINGLQYCVAKM